MSTQTLSKLVAISAVGVVASLKTSDKEKIRDACASLLVGIAQVADEYGLTVQEIDVLAKEKFDRIKKDVDAAFDPIRKMFDTI